MKILILFCIGVMLLLAHLWSKVHVYQEKITKKEKFNRIEPLVYMKRTVVALFIFHLILSLFLIFKNTF